MDKMLKEKIAYIHGYNGSPNDVSFNILSKRLNKYYEIIGIDNTDGKFKSSASALNFGVKKAKGGSLKLYLSIISSASFIRRFTCERFMLIPLIK